MRSKELSKNINIWNNLWKNKFFNPNLSPTLNIEYFYKFHLPKKNIKNFKILDIGFGNGRNAIFLSNLGFDVYGIDSSKIVVKKIKKIFKKNSYKFKSNSYTKMDFPNNFFNAIIAEASLYYGKKEDLIMGIKEIERVLKKNGLIRIYTKSNMDKYYLKNIKKTKILKIKKNVWEKDLNLTFLSKDDIYKILKNFKNIKLGIDEFNFINYKKKHSYWVVTANKK